jgi:[protein-PII] uridylyltransferase
VGQPPQVRPPQVRPQTSFPADRARRTASTDRWLASLLGNVSGVALVAVGGYGRRELLPGSDLDVLLLHDGQPGIADLADKIWYPIWDSGAHLDHAVRTPAEARQVARDDLRVALSLLHARYVAGDAELATQLRAGALADWRASARTRLADLHALHVERTQRCGELAFLLEPDLKEARGGLRDAQAIHAVAAAWVAPGPGPRVRAAQAVVLDARHALHEVTGRAADRLVLQEQDEVARALDLADADVLLRQLAGAGRAIAYALDQSLRGRTGGHSGWAGRGRADEASGDRLTAGQQGRTGQAGSDRGRSGRGRSARGSSDRGRSARGGSGRAVRGATRGGPVRTPLADGLVAHGGEVVLARSADPAADPALPLRAAAAAAQAGLPLAPRTFARLAQCPPLPVPWPASARQALAALLGAGQAAIGVWEALEQEGLIVDLLPDWDRVSNRPQRNPLHTFTVDRHLVETAAHAAALTRNVARPDLLLISALLHDIGKGWPGDHLVSGEVVARDTARRMGFGTADAELIAGAVRHHLLLPRTATRRDLDDPETVAHVAVTVGSRTLLELLHALAIADGRATGPAAWNDWKSGLVAELVRRVEAVLQGEPPPAPLPLRPDQIALAEAGTPAVMFAGSEVTIVAPNRPGLLWQAAGVLASHRLGIRSANATCHGGMAVTAFDVAPPYGQRPDATLVTADLRRALAGTLDVAARLEKNARNDGPPSVRNVRTRGSSPARTHPHPAPPVAPPKVTLVHDASRTATVVEVRAHDAPGLLWRIGRALGECGLDVRAARVETLGAEAVDVFYVTDGSGRPVSDPALRRRIAAEVRASLA